MSASSSSSVRSTPVPAFIPVRFPVSSSHSRSGSSSASAAASDADIPDPDSLSPSNFSTRPPSTTPATPNSVSHSSPSRVVSSQSSSLASQMLLEKTREIDHLKAELRYFQKRMQFYGEQGPFKPVSDAGDGNWLDVSESEVSVATSRHPKVESKSHKDMKKSKSKMNSTSDDNVKSHRVWNDLLVENRPGSSFSSLKDQSSQPGQGKERVNGGKKDSNKTKTHISGEFNTDSRSNSVESTRDTHSLGNNGKSSLSVNSGKSGSALIGSSRVASAFPNLPTASRSIALHTGQRIASQPASRKHSAKSKSAASSARVAIAAIQRKMAQLEAKARAFHFPLVDFNKDFNPSRNEYQSQQEMDAEDEIAGKRRGKRGNTGNRQANSTVSTSSNHEKRDLPSSSPYYSIMHDSKSNSNSNSDSDSHSIANASDLSHFSSVSSLNSRDFQFPHQSKYRDLEADSELESALSLSRSESDASIIGQSNQRDTARLEENLSSHAHANDIDPSSQVFTLNAESADSAISSGFSSSSDPPSDASESHLHSKSRSSAHPNLRVSTRDDHEYIIPPSVSPAALMEFYISQRPHPRAQSNTHRTRDHLHSNSNSSHIPPLSMDLHAFPGITQPSRPILQEYQRLAARSAKLHALSRGIRSIPMDSDLDQRTDQDENEENDDEDNDESFIAAGDAESTMLTDLSRNTSLSQLSDGNYIVSDDGERESEGFESEFQDEESGVEYGDEQDQSDANWEQDQDQDQDPEEFNPDGDGDQDIEYTVHPDHDVEDRELLEIYAIRPSASEHESDMEQEIYRIKR